MRAARRIGSGLRRLLPVALCALAGHLSLYGSLVPQTGDHGYLVWYEPALASLSVVAAAFFAGLLVAAAFGRRIDAGLLPDKRASSVGTVAPKLALAATTFLLCQETAESSVEAGTLARPGLSVSQLLVAIAVIGVASLLLALVTRSCTRLISLVGRPVVRPRPADVPLPAPRPLLLRRFHPLARRRGLRAPPLAA